jgi:hypothetical protein
MSGYWDGGRDCCPSNCARGESVIHWRIVQVRRLASSLSRPLGRPLRDVEKVLKRKLLPSQQLYTIPLDQCSAQSDSLQIARPRGGPDPNSDISYNPFEATKEKDVHGSPK